MIKSLEEVRDKEGNLIVVLENQRDDNFAMQIACRDEIDRDAETANISEKIVQESTKRFLLQLLKESTEQPIYSTHQYLRKGTVENWIVTKLQILNSRLHYCDLRLKTLK